MSKLKIAVISTYDELCGIAGYTKALVPQLEKVFEVTVFDLDQFLLRHQSPKVIRIADEEVKRIASELRAFDCVNIQLEHGTLGSRSVDILRRIRILLEASPKICVTFHTMIEPPGHQDRLLIWKDLLTFHWIRAFDRGRQARNAGHLGRGVYALLRRLQKIKPLSVIVHTRRDRRILNVVERIERVFDHPLAFYGEDVLSELRHAGDRAEFGALEQLPSNTVLVGCFGFVSRYKGFDTAIKALHRLPTNYHLAIFGGIHPNEVKKNQSIDPYLAELLDIMGVGRSWTDGIASAGGAVSLSVSGEDLVSLNSKTHPRDISDRVHFMGALSDSQFAAAMQACDIVLLPYLEVGQSSSGPMSIALNLRRPVVAARTKAFMQLARYEGDKFQMFDVGNYVQLADQIRGTNSAPERPGSAYGVESNLDVYRQAMSFDTVGHR